MDEEESMADQTRVMKESQTQSSKKPEENVEVVAQKEGIKAGGSSLKAGNYYNPFYVRAKKIKFSSQQGSSDIRSEARIYEKIARKQLLKVKNRARGDTAVNGMIYASRRLLNISRRILKKEVTPKQVYEFRYAKAEFEKAKAMHVAGATKLPFIYRTGDLKRIKKREEEEDRVIPKILDDLEP